MHLVLGMVRYKESNQVFKKCTQGKGRKKGNKQFTKGKKCK